ncbi:hypothetical protein PHLGIDRAFT_323326 [Phlebiopsis gigantea 11061_1 CR5-6]|uniref:Uncharacterized protein n=1 Tax=Phlebiopsis gigantea (strain 11061_1 CR5-6) TaxID=745531 RepID=A0A0C3SAQ8_PHLG1|nr:hypothetical protein PHLGIDRAFT_323326 [Phlebiopsis gigantea 11061_1 CR5-6]
MCTNEEKGKNQDMQNKSRFTLKLILLSDRDDIIRALRACSIWSIYIDKKITIPRSWNLFPGHQLPVLVKRGSTHEIVLMSWGLPPRRAEHSSICYVRSRNVVAPQDSCNWLWKMMRRTGRCVVICSGFYHWQYRNKKAYPYICEDKRSDPVLLAGLWKTDVVNGQEISSFIVITQQGIPSDPYETRSIQPAVIPDKNLLRWLAGDDWSEELPELLPGDSGPLGCGLLSREVGIEIQTSKANDESLAEAKPLQEDTEGPVNAEAGPNTGFRGPEVHSSQASFSVAPSSSQANATPSSSQSNATLASFWSQATSSSSQSSAPPTKPSPRRISLRPIDRPRGSGMFSLPTRKRKQGKGKRSARKDDANQPTEGSPIHPPRKRKRT